MEVYSIETKKIRLTTGSSKIDNLLGGGIESGIITELFGENGSGKTQVCHTLCVTCQFPTDLGGAAGCVLYIDTQGTFRTSKIIQICDRFGMDATDALDNISIARAYSSDYQIKLLDEAQEMMSIAKYGLIIVDSVTALFRSEYGSNKSEIESRQEKLNKFLRQLQKIVDIYGVVCVITNQVEECDNNLNCSKLVKPIGGNLIGHAAHTRLSLRRAAKNTRICKVYKCATLPEAEEKFAITDSGIDDVQ